MESVPGAGLVAVVVVVPAFAQADEGEDEAIAGIVAGFKPALALSGEPSS